VHVERATVTATSPLTVQIRSSLTPVPAHKLTPTTYTPAVNDEVAVAFFPDGDVLLLGTYT
jgi:hypothetical protein